MASCLLFQLGWPEAGHAHCPATSTSPPQTARLLHGTVDTAGISPLIPSSLATSKAKDEVLWSSEEALEVTQHCWPCVPRAQGELRAAWYRGMFGSQLAGAICLENISLHPTV